VNALRGDSSPGILLSRPPPIDAAVMASAARSGWVVYTQDYDDLVRFTSFFPDVKILTV
jgi:hypothetical protein